MNEHFKEYSTYIEQGNIKNRGCYNFSYQIRKIVSFLKGKVKIVKNYKDAKIIILLSCIAVPEFIKNNNLYIDNYLKINKKIILYGCLSNKIKKDILKKYGNNIFLISQENENKFNKIYKNINKDFIKIVEENNLDKKIFNNYIKSTYHLVIGRGCKNNCSFCVIREGKKIKSFSYKKILNNLQNKFNLGIRHFRITSDDIGTYGINNNLNLFTLLFKILKYNNSITLELGPIYPGFILENKHNFIKIFKTGKITEIFTAIQHRNIKILKLMNRKYNHKSLERFLIKIKNDFPKIKLSTHLIYGFPTETHKEFLNNLKNIKIFDQIQFYRFSKTYKMEDFIFKEPSIKILEKRANYIRKIFSNKKGLIIEEDNTKITIMKNKNKKKTFVEKYF